MEDKGLTVQDWHRALATNWEERDSPGSDASSLSVGETLQFLKRVQASLCSHRDRETGLHINAYDVLEDAAAQAISPRPVALKLTGGGGGGAVILGVSQADRRSVEKAIQQHYRPRGTLASWLAPKHTGQRLPKSGFVLKYERTPQSAGATHVKNLNLVTPWAWVLTAVICSLAIAALAVMSFLMHRSQVERGTGWVLLRSLIPIGLIVVFWLGQRFYLKSSQAVPTVFCQAFHPLISHPVVRLVRRAVVMGLTFMAFFQVVREAVIVLFGP
jgi:hypothetical protein